MDGHCYLEINVWFSGCLFVWPPAYSPSCQALRGKEPVEHSSPVRRFRVIAGMVGEVRTDINHLR